MEPGLPASSLAALLAWHVLPHSLAWIFVIGGILLLLWELTMPGFFIAVPAVVLIFMGLVGFMFPDFLVTVYSPILALVVAFPVTLATIHFYRRIAPADQAPLTTVGDSLRDRTGKVEVNVEPDSTRGKVKIQGQMWSATADEAIPAGARVRVVRSEGVHVVVERVPEAPAKDESGTEPRGQPGPGA